MIEPPEPPEPPAPPGASETRAQPPDPDDEGPWQRLSPLTMAASAAWIGGIALLSAVVTTLSGVNPLYTFPFVPVVVVAGVGLDYVRWTHTEYRLTTERLQLRSGILFRSHKSVPRDRIRSVDLSADVVYRIFGLTKVTVGTGQRVSAGDNAEIKLDPLSVVQADPLRTQLLRRDACTSPAAPPVGPEGDRAETPPYARHQPGQGTDAPTLGATPVLQDETMEADGTSGADGAGEAIATGGSATKPTQPNDPAEPAGPIELARLDWAWLKYAPLGVLTPVLGAAAIGGLFQVGDWFNTVPWKVEWFQPVVTPFRDVALPWILLVVAVTFLIVGAIGATAIWIEGWWGYRLERESGVFRVRRGLLTSRSISLEEARLRGIEVVEPLPLRRLGAGSTNAVATGMSSKSDQQKGPDKKALIPPAPLPVVERVAASVLSEPAAPMIGATMIGHPPVARRRRLLWAIAAVTLPLIMAIVLGIVLTDLVWWIAAPVLLIAYVVAALLAFDAYRNLGHALTPSYLLVRNGTLTRRTVALRRRGIIGWKIEQTFFQRRAGIATVTATTAAGAGQYSAYDVELGEGLRCAEDAVPKLLTPFLLRGTETPSVDTSEQV